MANTFWSATVGGDEIFLQSGSFSATIKDSVDVTSVDSVHGVGWDGTDTLFCGVNDSKLYKLSGKITTTLKTSQFVTTNPDGISWDGTNTPWVNYYPSPKLMLQSGQFTSTVKTSLDISAVEEGAQGITFDGTDTPWAGNADDKLYLTSGQFSGTLKTSLDVSGINTSPRGMGWDKTDTTWIGRTATATLFRTSGKFSGTLKTSLDVSGIDTIPTGAAVDEDGFWESGAVFTPTAVIF